MYSTFYGYILRNNYFKYLYILYFSLLYADIIVSEMCATFPASFDKIST